MRHYSSQHRTDLFSQNLLWIGYQAWQGYLDRDRGLVSIGSSVDFLDDSDLHYRGANPPNLSFRYIPQQHLSLYLQEWLVPDRSNGKPSVLSRSTPKETSGSRATASAIEPIFQAVASYQPETQLIFALEFGVTIDIGWCQNLKITPPECHRQIDRRWSEFQLTS